MWYAHAYGISRAYPPYHFFGASGIAIMDWAWYRDILHWMIGWFFTPLVLATMLLGSLLPARAPFGYVFHWWGVAISLFIVIVGAGTRIRGTNCPWSGRGRVHWEALGGGGASTGTLGEGENAYAVTCLLFFLPLATLSYLASHRSTTPGLFRYGRQARHWISSPRLRGSSSLSITASRPSSITAGGKAGTFRR